MATVSHAWARRSDQRSVGAAVRGVSQGPTGASGGFSLLELVLVVAIVAVVAAIAVPRYGRASARYRLDLAARRVAADLRMAQSRAKAASSPCTVLYTPATNEYKLLNVASLDGASGNYSVCLAADPYRVSLSLADFGGTSQITFNGWGLCGCGGTVVVKLGSQQRTVTVDGETAQVHIE